MRARCLPRSTAVRRRRRRPVDLPAQFRKPRIERRALLLAVVAMLLWSVALLAVGGGLALLMILGLAPAGIGYTLLVALLGVGLLALLWPIGRLATRWCYADQLAA